MTDQSAEQLTRERLSHADDGHQSEQGVTTDHVETHARMLLSFQQSIGNRAVADLLAAGTPGRPPMVVQTRPRGGRNRRTRGTSNTTVSSGPSNTTVPSGQSNTTVPSGTSGGTDLLGPSNVTLNKTVLVPINETLVTSHKTEIKQELPDEGPGETVGEMAGGLLDIWDGMETVVDPKKNVETRVGGGSKVVGGSSMVMKNVGKSQKWVSDQTSDAGALVGEVCGFIATAAECITAVREAHAKTNYERIMDFGSNIGPLVTGAIKTMEAYTKAMATESMFSKWVVEGLAPSLTMMSSSVKALMKFQELHALTVQRQSVASGLGQFTSGLASRGQTMLEVLDRRWYRTTVELISSMAEFSGEAIKWAAWGVGWLTGSMVGSGAKLIPLGVKTFNWLWQTANDWGGTAIWGGKTTAQVSGDMLSLSRAISSERNRPFGKLMCGAIGLPVAEAKQPENVLQALQAYAG